MSIKAYVGIMGSGKTYEVVTVVIYSALKRGRRVVSNIAGLNFELMRAAMIEEGASPDEIGMLVCVPHEKILDPLFWRTDYDADTGIDSFIQPGDLVVLDEIWRFWNGLGPKSEDGKEKRPDRVMNFVRMHRQMTHPETGISCDMAIITQDPADMHRSIKGVVEETYSMTKLTVIGSDEKYRVDVFQKTRITRKPLNSFFRYYDSAKFGWYKSHSQRQEGSAAAKEENIDGRGNILRGALFRFVIPVSLVVGAFAVWSVVSFFKPKESPKAEGGNGRADENPVSHAKQEGKPGAKKEERKRLDVSDVWRVVGWYSSEHGAAVVVQDDQKRLRVLYDPPAFKLHGLQISVVLPEGDTATTYSGAVVERSIIGGKM